MMGLNICGLGVGLVFGSVVLVLVVVDVSGCLEGSGFNVLVLGEIVEIVVLVVVLIVILCRVVW